jgi:hypothetical protein
VVDSGGTNLIVDGSGSAIVITTQPVLAGGANSTSTGYSAQRTARVVGQPLIADNGVIYPIDNLLLQ